ncbi:Uma2 family endonuclease [Hymenobacter aquaticus]|uniref:Uma2 family endonuclease n=1 Tax=Hymenobacter aquaticus TaxID=1867101 RepID=A0A4Z0Q4S7_9BACT|nr:Uma2 family endonuclease [Hymenobacter aquaticus]TGE24499.1 Uma2 family endonuclease [Hymenobacter aquaticus]
MHITLLPNEAPLTLSGPSLAQMTDDEFFDFCRQHPDLHIERTPQLTIVIMSPTGSLSSQRNAEINFQLSLWNRQQRLGRVFDSNGGFRLPDGSMRAPDAAWLTNARWDALTLEQQKKFAPLCPEFVLELASETDSIADLQAKMRDWLRNGAQLAWLVVPDTETAYIYRPGQPEPEVVQGFDNELSGETVLPGFQLRLAELR